MVFEKKKWCLLSIAAQITKPLIYFQDYLLDTSNIFFSLQPQSKGDVAHPEI
jgi:hypothetical protein